MPEQDPVERLRDLAARQRAAIVVPAEARAHALRAANSQRRRPLRKMVAAAFAGAVVLAGTGLAVAQIWGDQPGRPEEGIVCRSAPSLESNVVGVRPNADPIAACATVWQSGQLPNPDQPLPPGQPAPRLIACVGPNGGIEVLPGAEARCEALGFTPAAASIGESEAAIARLSERMTTEINSAECSTAQAVEEQARDILVGEGFADWDIVVDPAWVDSRCAKVAIDSTDRLVRVVGLPG